MNGVPSKQVKYIVTMEGDKKYAVSRSLGGATDIFIEICVTKNKADAIIIMNILANAEMKGEISGTISGAFERN